MVVQFNRYIFKKIKTALLSMTVILFVATGLFSVYHNTIVLPIEYNKELAELCSANPGDEIKFGRFDTDYMFPGSDRVSWLVLHRSDNDILLITKEGIASYAYLKKHAETDWADSDLHKFLNDSLYNQIFSSYEQGIIIDNPDCGDRPNGAVRSVVWLHIPD